MTRVSDYLVGSQFDEALAAGQDLIISWPFSDFGVDTNGGDMASPCSFRMFAQFLPFFNQEIRVLCYPRSPRYLNGISCPIIHLPRFTPLGVLAFWDSSPLNEPWPGCTRPMP